MRHGWSELYECGSGSSNQTARFVPGSSFYVLLSSVPDLADVFQSSPTG